MQHEDPLGGMLFALTHLCIFPPIVMTHFTCVFPSLTDDTHIVGPTLDVLPIFLKLQKEFEGLRFSMQLTKCVAWSP
jgi:hypothetical protein